MTHFPWLVCALCSTILLLGGGCGGTTHVVGTGADGSAGGVGGGGNSRSGSEGSQGGAGASGTQNSDAGVVADAAGGMGGSSSAAGGGGAGRSGGALADAGSIPATGGTTWDAGATGGLASGGAGSGGAGGVIGDAGVGGSSTGGVDAGLADARASGGQGGASSGGAGASGGSSSQGGAAGGTLSSSCPQTAPTKGASCDSGKEGPCFYEDCGGSGRTVATCPNKTWEISTGACTAITCTPYFIGSTIVCPAGQVCLTEFAQDPKCVTHTCGKGPITWSCVPGADPGTDGWCRFKEATVSAGPIMQCCPHGGTSC
jgi:hypothetical protein